MELLAKDMLTNDIDFETGSSVLLTWILVLNGIVDTSSPCLSPRLLSEDD
jgi:hypothetical protein